MDCYENKNVTSKNYENICINCGSIHDYQYINELSFRDYNMNMSNVENMAFFHSFMMNKTQ